MSNRVALPGVRPATYTPIYACLPRGRVKAYTGRGYERIFCTEGALWVTFENDPVDYVLRAGDHLAIPNGGKMLVSGQGCYRISVGLDGMDLADAS
jgi:quercetin dioxygenase-like cupin family protein